MSNWTPGTPTIGVNRSALLAALEKVIAVDPAGNVTIKALTITLDASASVRIKGASSVTVEGLGTLELKGAVVKLNGGGRPIARMGDQVNVAGPMGTVINGNPTVMA